jgi:hypothetical protein
MATLRDLIAIHSLGDRYAGTFTQPSLSSVVPWSGDAPFAVDLFVYKAPKDFFVLGLGDQHTETVTEWLNEADKSGLGVSHLCATFASGALRPPEADACYLVFEDGTLTADVLEWLLGQAGFFFFVYPHDHSIHALAPAKNALHALEVSGLKPQVVIPVLQFLRCIPVTPKRKRVSAPYDPVGAQIAELTGRTYVALQEKVYSLQRAWEHAIGTAPPPELKAIGQLCQDQVRRTKAVVQKARQRQDLIPVLGTMVDMLAFGLSECFSLCDTLEKQLLDYIDPDRTSSVTVSYSRAGKRVIPSGEHRLRSCPPQSSGWQERWTSLRHV